MKLAALLALFFLATTSQAMAQRLVPAVQEAYFLCLDTYADAVRQTRDFRHFVIAVGPLRSNADDAACAWAGNAATPRTAHDQAHAACKADYKYCLNFADSSGYYPAISQINAAGGTLTADLYQRVRSALLAENRNSQGGRLSSSGGGAVASAPATPSPQSAPAPGGGGLSNPGMATAANGPGNLNHCLRGMYDRAVDRGQRDVIATFDGFRVDMDLYFKNGCAETVTAYICYIREHQVYECIHSPDIGPGGISYTFGSIIGDRFFYFVCRAGDKSCNDLGLEWYHRSYTKPRGTDLRRVP